MHPAPCTCPVLCQSAPSRGRKEQGLTEAGSEQDGTGRRRPRRWWRTPGSGCSGGPCCRTSLSWALGWTRSVGYAPALHQHRARFARLVELACSCCTGSRSVSQICLFTLCTPAGHSSTEPVQAWLACSMCDTRSHYRERITRFWACRCGRAAGGPGALYGAGPAAHAGVRLPDARGDGRHAGCPHVCCGKRPC